MQSRAFKWNKRNSCFLRQLLLLLIVDLWKQVVYTRFLSQRISPRWQQVIILLFIYHTLLYSLRNFFARVARGHWYIIPPHFQNFLRNFPFAFFFFFNRGKMVSFITLLNKLGPYYERSKWHRTLWDKENGKGEKIKGRYILPVVQEVEILSFPILLQRCCFWISGLRDVPNLSHSYSKRMLTIRVFQLWSLL